MVTGRFIWLRGGYLLRDGRRTNFRRPAGAVRLMAAGGMLTAAVLCSCTGRSYGERELLSQLRDAGVADPGRDGWWEPTTRQDVVETDLADAPPTLEEPGIVSLADLLRLAESQNAALAAARSEAGIAAGRAWQAWLYPNPEVEVEAEDITFGDGTKGAEIKVGIAQPIVLSRRRERAVEAAEAERAAALAEAEVVRRTLFGDVAEVYAQLGSLREQARLNEQLSEMIQATLDVAQTRLEARAAPETEVVRVRVELQRIEAASRRVSREIEAAERRLSVLLGGARIDAALLEGTTEAELAPMDFALLERLVREDHPALTARRSQVAAAEARLEGLRQGRLPDLSVRAAVGYSDAEEDGIVELGAGMTLPLWDGSQGAILSERFAVMQARQRLAAEADELVEALAQAVAEYEIAREEAGAMRTGIVPDAQRAFDLTRAAYRAGRASFMDVFDAQRTLVEARVELTESLGRASAARARVARIAGVPVDAGDTWRADEATAAGTPDRPTGE